MRRTGTDSVNDLWQADLVQMVPHSKINDGYKYFLTQINVYSKFAHSETLKNKSGGEFTHALAKFWKLRLLQNFLYTDEGMELFNWEFSVLTKRRNIEHYRTFTEMKASVVEHLNRTIKTYVEGITNGLIFYGNLFLITTNLFLITNTKQSVLNQQML